MGALSYIHEALDPTSEPTHRRTAIADGFMDRNECLRLDPTTAPLANNRAQGAIVLKMFLR
jgi:hypothetical protein